MNKQVSLYINLCIKQRHFFLLRNDDLYFVYSLNQEFLLLFKVSEYPFKQNKHILKTMKVLLFSYFYDISLNVIRPTFFNIYNLPFSRFLSIRKIKVKLKPKNNYFFYFMSSCTHRTAVFSNLFALICSLTRDK